MKIAHCVLTGEWGAREQEVARLANLQSRDHRVALVAREMPAAGTAELRRALEPGVALASVARSSPPRSAAHTLAKQLAFQPDIVHFHDRPAYSEAKRLAPATAATVATIDQRFMLAELRDIDAVVATSAWQLRDIPASYRGARCLVPLPSFATPPARPGAAAELRQRLSASRETFVIGAWGALLFVDGFDDLCRAFARAALPDARLVILGEGPHREALARLARRCDGIVLAGDIPHAAEVLPGLDLFVSSARGGTPERALLAAMRAGRPVVATRTLGARDLLRDYPERLVELDDVEALAAGIRRAFEHRDAAVTYDLSAHDPATCNAALLALYASLVPRATAR